MVVLHIPAFQGIGVSPFSTSIFQWLIPFPRCADSRCSAAVTPPTGSYFIQAGDTLWWYCGFQHFKALEQPFQYKYIPVADTLPPLCGFQVLSSSNTSHWLLLYSAGDTFGGVADSSISRHWSQPFQYKYIPVADTLPPLCGFQVLSSSNTSHWLLLYSAGDTLWWYCIFQHFKALESALSVQEYSSG